MTMINIQDSTLTEKWSPKDHKIMEQVVEALRTWNHEAAKEPWGLLVASHANSVGILGDKEIKHLIWYIIQKSCLTCASRGENEFMRLVEDIAAADDEADLGSLESQSIIDKEQQLAQMVLTISKKLYDSAMIMLEKELISANQ